jgi:hypothetical protein
VTAFRSRMSDLGGVPSIRGRRGQVWHAHPPRRVGPSLARPFVQRIVAKAGTPTQLSFRSSMWWFCNKACPSTPRSYEYERFCVCRPHGRADFPLRWEAPACAALEEPPLYPEFVFFTSVIGNKRSSPFPRVASTGGEYYLDLTTSMVAGGLDLKSLDWSLTRPIRGHQYLIGNKRSMPKKGTVIILKVFARHASSPRAMSTLNYLIFSTFAPSGLRRAGPKKTRVFCRNVISIFASLLGSELRIA